MRTSPAIGALAATLIAAAPALAAAPERRFAFDQPAQPLATALLAVSARTGAVIAAPAGLTAGRRAPGLSGVMPLNQALRTLLTGSDLEFSISASGVVSLKRGPEVVTTASPPPVRSPPPRPPEEPTLVTPISVLARPLAEPATEQPRDAPAQVDVLLEDQLRGAGAQGLGDALRQMPGVAAGPEAGEARQIAVRGVGGRFTRVRVNGMETLATFGASNAVGGTNRGRAFDYNIFAADLFKQVRLQKTASADVDEGSLGATIDMRTRSPMDLPRRHAVLVAEAGYQTLSGKAQPRLSAVLSRRDAAGRLGVLVSAAYSGRSVVEAGASAGQWETGVAVAPGFGSAATPLDLATVNAALHARIPRLELMEIDQQRLGLTGSLEWRPDEATRIALDTIYAELRSSRRESLLESFTFRTPGVCAAPPDPRCGLNAVAVTQADIALFGGRKPVLIAGRFDNVDIRSEARRDELNTIFRQTTLAATRRFKEGLEGRLLAGFSRSDFSNPVQQTLYLEQFDVDGFAYDFADRDRPALSFGNADLVAPGAWTLSEFRSDPNWVDNSYRSLALDLENRTAPIGWRVGVLAKTYRNVGSARMRSNGGIGNVNADLPDGLRGLAIADYARLVGQGVDFGVAGAPGRWLAIDTGAALSSACPIGRCPGFELGPAPVAGLNYDVTERSDAAFLQLALPRTASRRFWGEAGVRIVHTRVEATSLDVGSDAVARWISASNDYWSTLPSLNLAWSLSPEAVLRFGAARVMVRPDLISLRPGVSVSTTGAKSVSSGNPDLRPTRADAFDLSLDWRPRPGVVLSAAVYRKTIATTVQAAITRPAPFSANPFGLPDSVAATACGAALDCSPALPIWQFSRPINSGPGKLTGVEASFRVPLGEAWTIQGAAAYTRTEVRLLDQAGAWVDMQDALGAPRLAANLGLGYQRPGLEVRAALSHRSRYLATIPAPNGGDVDGVDPLTTLDAAAKLVLSPNLTLTAEAANLTDAYQRQFSDRTLIPTYRHHTGREFRLGLRWAM
ncbi:TonB-dependent receptor [Caulobacter endophyticus]|uniref:TonB-dependent receptor n=1 Tax=Caulobacter endophyticus TaxID=2172652 RepID=UPI002410022E|nr:TonB-dependent receptor [Caulobacter endophyticus]MDG2531591.1 TonB-dependent receptor [Caulobacter endophyticus]